jgi:hypothetical protein
VDSAHPAWTNIASLESARPANPPNETGIVFLCKIDLDRSWVITEYTLELWRMTNWRNELPDPDPDVVARFLKIQDRNGVTFHFFSALGRVIVVTTDPGKLAIMLRSSREASRESGWDVDVMSCEEFEHKTTWFRHAVATLKGVDEGLANQLVADGFLSFEDLSVIDPNDLREYGDLSDDVAEAIIQQSETNALETHRR